jgi:hypothetical protein
MIGSSPTYSTPATGATYGTHDGKTSAVKALAR